MDTTPSLHRRINAPSLLLAFAHIHGKAGTPTRGIYSALVGLIDRSGSVCRRGGFPCKTTPFSLLSIPPRLRTGESMHLFCVWPSPTSMARREHQRGASTVRWWVRTVRFCVQRGRISVQNDPILATLAAFDTTPSPHRRINAPSLRLAFAHIHGGAGTPTGGLYSALVGQNERSGSVCRRRGGFPYKTMTLVSSRLSRHHPVSAQANQCT